MEVARAACLLCALLVALPQALSISASSAERSGPASLTGENVSLHGVQLTLSVPGKVFPRYSLTPIGIHIHNSSGRPIGWMLPCPGLGAWKLNPGGDNPEVDVLTPQGTVTYPPALPQLGPRPPCPVLVPILLRTGQDFQQTTFVVLRSRVLRVSWVFFFESDGAGSSPNMRIAFQRLLALTSGSPPRATIRSLGPSVYAKLQRPPGARGPLRYARVAECSSSAGRTYIQEGQTWRRASGLRIQPGCARPLVWEALAGWVGMSVVRISYRAP
jgi:hypothetical protein